MKDSDLVARFSALDAFLSTHQALWREKPFTHMQLRWEQRWPELSDWLRARSLEEADAPYSTQPPHPFPEWAAQAQALAHVEALTHRPRQTLAPIFQVDVPGRKWQQIDAFAQCLHFEHKPQHWLDWCSGKGHLGRRVAHDGTPLTCWEYNAVLVTDGQRLSHRLHLNAHHQQQDVLAENAITQLNAAHTPIALHACGDLHIRLLKLATQQGCRQLAIAPCCYNRIQSTDYQALSQTAQHSQLHLNQDDLRLSLSETVTAGARIRRQRDSSMARRLAFDILQRELRGVDAYLPTPSLPVDWLKKPFSEYCRDLAALKGLSTPQEYNWAQLEAFGWERLAIVRNLEQVRGLFRRPIELWLVLDRALFLQEQGYRVQLGTFCSYQLTPRNLLLLAEKSNLEQHITD